MKIKTKIFAIMIILITIINIYCAPLTAQATNQAQATTQNQLTDTTQTTVPEPNFKIYSEAAILIDSNTGKVLYGKNEHQKQYPASTTKIITAILAIENCKLTDRISASYDAVMSIPSGYANAGIQPGEEFTVKDLLNMFLIHSANEIGNIFAEHISGSIEDFALLMNQKAAELGCQNTHFTNPSGIHDPEHYSTAYDMALIARHCMKNDTFRSIVSTLKYSVEATDKTEKRYFRNTNDLIDPSSKYYYESAIGMKTGFTSQAKNCLIGASLKDNLELITVALGAEAADDGRSGRYVDTLNLFDYGYANYKTQQIATKNTVIEEIVVGNATKETENLSLLLKDSITGITPANLDLNNLDYTVKLNETISAPISEGEILGKITYNIDGITYTSDLIANHSVEELDIKLLITQVGLALLVLFILFKLLFRKKKTKSKKKYSSKNNKRKKSNRTSDSIYKF